MAVFVICFHSIFVSTVMLSMKVNCTGIIMFVNVNIYCRGKGKVINYSVLKV